MILGVKKLLKLVKTEKLVENLSERELKNPEGAGFDIRIGELYKLKSKAEPSDSWARREKRTKFSATIKNQKSKSFLGIDERRTPDIELVSKYDKKKSKKVFLQPRTYYLMKTIEKVNLPENLLALFTPRSTLYRSGVYIFGGQTAPGYQGELTTGIYNFRDEKFELEMGARVLHIMFFEVKGKTSLYRGQWQGGRVTTKKKEKQV